MTIGKSFSVVLFTVLATFNTFYTPQPLLPYISDKYLVSPTTSALLLTVPFIFLCFSPVFYGALLIRSCQRFQVANGIKNNSESVIPRHFYCSSNLLQQSRPEEKCRSSRVTVCCQHYYWWPQWQTRQWLYHQHLRLADNIPN